MVKMSKERFANIVKKVESYDKGNLSQVNHILNDVPISGDVGVVTKLIKDLGKEFEKDFRRDEIDDGKIKGYVKTLKHIKESSDRISKYMEDAIKHLK